MEMHWTGPAAKQLRRLPKSESARIAAKMRFFANQPDPLKFTKAMVGQSGRYRFRIGNYRVIVRRWGDDLYVMRLDRRDAIYR